MGKTRVIPYLTNFYLSGASVQNAFQESRTKALQGTVKLLRNDKLIALGTLVDPKGFILTKASSCVGALVQDLQMEMSIN